MGSEKVQISSVGRKTLTIVVKSSNNSLGLGNTANAPAVAIVTISSVFVDVVTQVDNIVYRVLTNRVSIGVEEAEGCIQLEVYSRGAEAGNLRKLLQEYTARPTSAV